MDDKVLVVYASKYGSTAEIAEAIARRIKDLGIDVDVKTALEVERLNGYQGVVLGSAVYAGQWRKEAASFLEDQQEELSTRKVWLFSSGPTGDGDPVELMNGWSFPRGCVRQLIGSRSRGSSFSMGCWMKKNWGLPRN